MKFADLEFVHTGCCGSHAWAEVRHENGLLTRVYREEQGYSASTHAGQNLLKSQTPLADEAEVEARLAEDGAA
jgi:hypothetical protein